MNHKYKLGIIGYGLIGHKRADAIKNFKNVEVVAIADSNKEKALDMNKNSGIKFSNNWKEIVEDNDIDIIIISTTNDSLSKITIEALKNGKHVLVEKPAGRNLKELKAIVKCYESLAYKPRLMVGYNHRFHPSFEKAKSIIKNESIGEIMFIRARYGHGARLNYDKEWRAFKKIAGGGELLDQGSHIIDLARYFIGNFSSCIGITTNSYWKQEVEDNCFATLENPHHQLLNMHVSTTQWKNIFSFEIFCRTGQINIDGLGRSYGTETLTFYKMKPEMGIPDKFVFEWKEEDKSWVRQFENFLGAIENNIEPDGNIYDALEVMKNIDAIYRWNSKYQKKNY